jgi:hypothetical protein
MPTADASQFTQMKKHRAIQARDLSTSQRVITHLYQPVPTASGITNFLPSFSSKITSSLIIVKPNFETASRTKTGVTPQITV